MVAVRNRRTATNARAQYPGRDPAVQAYFCADGARKIRSRVLGFESWVQRQRADDKAVRVCESSAVAQNPRIMTQDRLRGAAAPRYPAAKFKRRTCPQPGSAWTLARIASRCRFNSLRTTLWETRTRSDWLRSMRSGCE